MSSPATPVANGQNFSNYPVIGFFKKSSHLLGESVISIGKSIKSNLLFVIEKINNFIRSGFEKARNFFKEIENERLKKLAEEKKPSFTTLKETFQGLRDELLEESSPLLVDYIIKDLQKIIADCRDTPGRNAVQKRIQLSINDYNSRNEIYQSTLLENNPEDIRDMLKEVNASQQRLADTLTAEINLITAYENEAKRLNKSI